MKFNKIAPIFTVLASLAAVAHADENIPSSIYSTPELSNIPKVGDYRSPELLNPVNHTLVIIDYEDVMATSARSSELLELNRNIGAVAWFSRFYRVPTVLTLGGETGFAGPLMPVLREIYPGAKPYRRTSTNTWEDDATRNAIIGKGKKKLVMMGLWSDVCLTYPVLSAIKAGYDVYFIADASATTNKVGHDLAVQRMIQAGAHPLSTVDYVFELVRDWARPDNTSPVRSKALHEAFKKYGILREELDYTDYMVPTSAFYHGFDYSGMGEPDPKPISKPAK
ncbi:MULTISPECIES: isochorismatase family protein [Burkholderia]|uniref:isochorismatase family protein n=1 Tax=Burkholderia TaxID=32008 RepID=UPI000A9188C4|nr:MULTISPECIES: isochorismatase family protein [unclassified Burkholderia]